MRHTTPIALALLLGISASAHAESALPSVMIPFSADRNAEFAIRGLTITDSHAKGTRYDTDVRYMDLKYRQRWTDSEDFQPVFGISLNTLGIDSIDPTLPEGAADLFFGGGARHTINDESSIAWGVGIGYAGEVIDAEGDFTLDAAEDGLYLAMGIGYTREIDENSSITFLIDYDGNRSVFPDIPLPGVVYNRRFQTELPLSITVGFPYTTVYWQPLDKLNVTATYFFPESVEGKVSYTFTEQFELYSSLSSRNSAFALGDLPDDRRLFFTQSLAELGFVIRPAQPIELTLAGGWAFSQEFTTGFDRRDDTTLRKLSDAPYLRLGMGFRF